jgi:hypothetical protein
MKLGDTPPKTYTGPELVEKLLSGLDFNAWMRTEGGSALMRKMAESQRPRSQAQRISAQRIATEMLQVLWDEMLADIIAPPDPSPTDSPTKDEVFIALLNERSALRQKEILSDPDLSMDVVPGEIIAWQKRWRDALIGFPSADPSVWAATLEESVAKSLDENVSFDAPPVDRVDPSAVTLSPPTVNHPDFDEQEADKHEIAEQAEEILAEAEIGGES